MASLQGYVAAQPAPTLDPWVHNTRTDPAHARAWGLARRGHHSFADGRAARHLTAPPVPCLCGAPVPTLRHALRECPSFADLRTRWVQQVGLSPELTQWALARRILFAPDHPHNSANYVRSHVTFVGRVEARRRHFVLPRGAPAA